MQSIVSKGKNITEAIDVGLDILGVTKEEVSIEVIQYETKGFLGIGSKEAVVKLIKQDSDSQQLQLEEMVDQLIPESPVEKADKENSLPKEEANKEPELDPFAGKVWVTNGQLYCKSSPEHFPMVTINNGIKLYKNNQVVTEKTVFITENDLYEIKVENVEKDTSWQVTMDENKLKVYLKVYPGYKLIRTVQDVEADNHIELKAVERKEIHNTLTYSEIIQKLETLRVKHGFHQDEMIKATEATEPGTFEIAAGRMPKQGKNGWIELKINMETIEGPIEKENGNVDFRNIRTFPMIERGKVIAIVHPPVPGELGTTVTNEPIPFKQTLPITVRAKQGVILLDDKIVATESGRPKIDQRGQLVRVSVMPKLLHQGNVDIASGNIRFMGDVEVTADIKERMLVEAEGDIIVHQTVVDATLTASGAVISYGNIIGSEISAGKNNMLIVELGHLLGMIHQNIEQIISLITQLTRSPAFKSGDFSQRGLQPLIRILLEKKCRNFPPLVKKYVRVVRDGERFLQDDSWRMAGVSLSQLFLSLTNEVISLEHLTQLSQKIAELHEFSKTTVEPDSYITIPNALNSKLYCSGNILILGQGCVNTKVHAVGMLKISGILRGGSVYGRLGAEINEAGAESATTTVIAVPNDQVIRINKAMEGTTIKFGNVKHTFKETRYHITARLENERIIF